MQAQGPVESWGQMPARLGLAVPDPGVMFPGPQE